MVVIVEEEKVNRVSPINLILWGAILLIIVVSVYYIFFRRPASVEVQVPEYLQSTQQIFRLKLNPNSILNDPKFQLRQEYIPPPVPGNLGRENPFDPL